MSKYTCDDCKRNHGFDEASEFQCRAPIIRGELTDAIDECGHFVLSNKVKMHDRITALERELAIHKRALELAVREQPCDDFREDGRSEYNAHQCCKCGGIVRFCDNCKLDHHDGGYRSCYIQQATAEIDKEKDDDK